MEKTSNRFTVRRLAVTGLLSALVFVFSWIQIPIGEVARIHLGNVFCALSGLLFGPLTGGLASRLRQYAVRLYESCCTSRKAGSHSSQNFSSAFWPGSSPTGAVISRWDGTCWARPWAA